MYVALGIAAFMRAGRDGDIAAILRERGRAAARLDREATAISGLAMTVVTVVGAIVRDRPHGEPGRYGLFCAVSGIAHAAALFELRRQR